MAHSPLGSWPLVEVVTSNRSLRSVELQVAGNRDVVFLELSSDDLEALLYEADGGGVRLQ